MIYTQTPQEEESGYIDFVGVGRGSLSHCLMPAGTRQAWTQKLSVFDLTLQLDFGFEHLQGDRKN